MPARSKAQRRLMGAELRRRRQGKKGRLKGLTVRQLEEFASTKEKGLPKRKKRKSSHGRPRHVRFRS